MNCVLGPVRKIAELELSYNEGFDNDISNNDIISLYQQMVNSFILNNVNGDNEISGTILNNLIHFLDNEIQRREMLELENDENELQRAIINSLIE